MGQSENTRNKYVVFGFGVSGKASYKYLKSLSRDVRVVSKGPVKDWNNGLADPIDCYEQGTKSSRLVLESADSIILSPGISPQDKMLQGIKAEIVNDIELFYRNLSKKVCIVAITGSNGKTTTVSLIDYVLRSSGVSVFCGGNIGESPVNFLLNGEKEDVVLLELSSFQLESIRSFRANFSGVLNINMTHEERYTSFKDYQSAKLRIFKNREIGDRHFCDELTSPLVKEAEVYNSPQRINTLQSDFDLSEWNLPGRHNLENLSMTVCIARCLGVSDRSLQILIDEFNGVENRIEFIGHLNNAKLYNDSKSTNIFSSISALDAFQGKRILLLLGGQIRSQESLNLNELRRATSMAHKTIFFGELSRVEEVSCDQRIHKLSSLDFSTLNDETFDVILFSPGFPSFDEFKSYSERGDYIKAAYIDAKKRT